MPILVNVAFFTLLERKVLGLSQSRKGPNKVRVVGIMQPISDAVKLFVKENKAPLRGGRAFFFAPATALVIMLASWQLIPGGGGADRGEHSLILLIVFLRVGLYPLLIAGWSSNRKYALVGALRGVAQTISYEIRIALIALSFSFLVARLHLRA